MPSSPTDTRHPADKAHQAALFARNLQDLIGRHPGGRVDAIVLALTTIGMTIRHHSPDGDAFEPIAEKMEGTFSKALRSDPPSDTVN